MNHNASSQFAAFAQQYYQTAWSLYEQGKLAEAERHFRASLDYGPDHPAALTGLGIVCFQSGRPQEALACLQRAAHRAPNDPMVGNTFGYVLNAIGRPQEALFHLERAVAAAPDAAEIQTNLGNVLAALNRPDDALARYKKTIALNPRLSEPYNNIGSIYANQDRHEDALEYYRKALALNPGNLDAWRNLGLSLCVLVRPAEALVAFDRALALDPWHAPAWIGRCEALLSLGRIEEARAACDRALDLAPNNPTFYRALADVKTFREGDPQIAAMEALMRQASSIPPQEQINLHFALAKAYDDLHKPNAAFDHLEKGNALKRTFVAYDEGAELGVLAGIAKTFTRGRIDARRGLGDPSALPVFIVGMPRSGTTLVEQMLASHPEAFGAGELPDFGFTAKGGYTSRHLSFDPSSLSGDELRRIGTQYVAKLRQRAPQASRIVDKLPANFLFIGLIHLALPNARIVHVRRDPVATCFSCYTKVFAGSLNYVYDLGELARYYRAYEALMAHWRAVLPEGVMLEVEYETLVGDFEPQAKQIVDYCGLAWDARCLSFHKTERPIRTASALQVRQPLFKNSIERWRAYEPSLAPLIAGLRQDPQIL